MALVLLCIMVASTVVLLAAGAHWAVFVVVWGVGGAVAVRLHAGRRATAAYPAYHGITLRSAPDISPQKAHWTSDDLANAAAFTLFFLAWMVFYLFWLRPRMNEYIVRYVSAYPAMLHVFPILGLPTVAAWLHERIFGGRR